MSSCIFFVDILNHTSLALVLLAVMVLFLFAIVLLGIRELKSLRLRISYLEGTLDMVYQSQEQLNKLIVSILENS